MSIVVGKSLLSCYFTRCRETVYDHVFLDYDFEFIAKNFQTQPRPHHEKM